MTHGPSPQEDRLQPASLLFRQIEAIIYELENHLSVYGMLSLVVASAVLGYGAISRRFFDAGGAGHDELAVILLAGDIFLSASRVQRARGHIAIEAMAHWLPASANRVRQLMSDGASIAFCLFFAWKSWALVALAWIEHHTTTSTWAPPLWIPYSLMATGMSLLCIQLALQIGQAILGSRANS